MDLVGSVSNIFEFGSKSISSRTGLTKELAKLGAPIVLSNLAYTLLGAVDTLFMGRVGVTAVGAVGVAGMSFIAAILLPRGLIGGTMTFVSRMYGGGDKIGAGRFLLHFIALALIISPIALVLPWVFKTYFNIIKPDPEVAKAALAFLKVRLFEVPFTLVSTAVFGFLTGVGNTKTPMFISWMTVLINIFANWVLVFGKFGFPALGIVGSASGTVISVIIQCIITVVVAFSIYSKEYGLLRFSLPSFTEIRRMVRIGGPMGVMDFIEVAGWTTFLTLISKLGTVELAASQIANQVTGLAYMPGFALSAATGSLVGRYIGAKDLGTAEKVGYRGASLGVILMGLFGLLFLAFPGILARLFTHDPKVVSLAAYLLKILAFYQIFDAMNIVFRGALNGAGDTRFTMAAMAIGAWGVLVPLVYLGAFVVKWGVLGAWIGAFTYIVLIGTVLALRFRSGRWKTMTI